MSPESKIFWQSSEGAPPQQQEQEHLTIRILDNHFNENADKCAKARQTSPDISRRHSHHLPISSDRFKRWALESGNRLGEPYPRLTRILHNRETKEDKTAG